MDEIQKTPKWLILLIVIIASIEPLTHLWIAHGNHGNDAVPTGLHIPDSSIFIHCMNMFQTDFYSPYASIKAPNGPNSPAYLPTPFHWLYAIAGQIGHTFNASMFLFLGLINGLASALYFWAAWKLIQLWAPKIAPTAFVFFLIPANLGGIVYLTGIVAGWTQQHDFDQWFERISMYTLAEGSYLGAWQHMTRMYYTLSLALGYAAIREFITARTIQCNRHLFYACLLLFAGSVINIRIGAFILFVIGLYLWSQPWSNWKNIAKPILQPAVAWLLAASGYALMSILNPTFSQNTTTLVQEGMWLSPFVFTVLLILPLIGSTIWKTLQTSPGRTASILHGIVGYLALFSILFIGHKLYYGNWFRAGDSHAAVIMSDWALLGVIPGIFALRRFKKPETDEQSVDGFFVLWFLLFTFVAISAFGQGWFLQFTPQRIMIMMGLPVAILTARSLYTLQENKPGLTKAYATILVSTGAISLIVGSLFFQGPLYRTPGAGPFAKLHAEMMSAADAELLKNLPEGRVLAPIRFADVVALENGNPVLGGIGGTDLSDLKSTDIDPHIARFFSLDMNEAERANFIMEWEIDFVIFPDSRPLSNEVVDAIKSTPGFALVHATGAGATFKVN